MAVEGLRLGGNVSLGGRSLPRRLNPERPTVRCQRDAELRALRTALAHTGKVSVASVEPSSASSQVLPPLPPQSTVDVFAVSTMFSWKTVGVVLAATVGGTAAGTTAGTTALDHHTIPVGARQMSEGQAGTVRMMFRRWIRR